MKQNILRVAILSALVGFATNSYALSDMPTDSSVG